MHVMSPRKALVAFASVMAVLAFMATPASADPPYEFEFTGGTFNVVSLGAAPDINFTIGQAPAEDPCDLYDPNDRTSIEVDFFGSGPNYTTRIVPSTGSPAPNPTGQLGKSTFEDTSTGVWYQVDLDISDPNVTGANNDGTLTSTGANTWALSQNVWIEVRVYDLGTNPTPPCEKEDLACSLIIVFDANITNPATGTYTGTVTPTVVTTITNLGGTGGVFVNGECDAGLAGSFDGSTATLSGGSLVFVP